MTIKLNDCGKAFNKWKTAYWDNYAGTGLVTTPEVTAEQAWHAAINYCAGVSDERAIYQGFKVEKLEKEIEALKVENARIIAANVRLLQSLTREALDGPAPTKP